jgi:hypothetical protein
VHGAGIVLRVTQEVGRLRRHKAYAAVRLAMIAMLLAGRTGFRVVHVSIQRHQHPSGHHRGHRCALLSLNQTK